MGKVGVPPAVVCKSPLMQAGRLLYPLFLSSLRNMSNLMHGRIADPSCEIVCAKFSCLIYQSFPRDYKILLIELL